MFRSQYLEYSLYISKCSHKHNLTHKCNTELGCVTSCFFIKLERLNLKSVCVFVSDFVQFLQYYYQSGCLYRLRALGERHTMDLTVGEWERPDMDLTVVMDRCVTDSRHSLTPVLPPLPEGFQSWMWRGLTFLLPFLFGGHVSHLLSSLVLFSPLSSPHLSLHLCLLVIPLFSSFIPSLSSSLFSSYVPSLLLSSSLLCL